MTDSSVRTFDENMFSIVSTGGQGVHVSFFPKSTLDWTAPAIRWSPPEEMTIFGQKLAKYLPLGVPLYLDAPAFDIMLEDTYY